LRAIKNRLDYADHSMSKAAPPSITGSILQARDHDRGEKKTLIHPSGVCLSGKT
jgi:hypothetical protein